MSKIHKKDSSDDKNTNKTTETTKPTTTTPANTTTNNYQRVSERVQQWNRAIPEAGYIQLGTLRYGVRLSNPNLSQYSNNSIASERQSINSLQTQSSNLSLNPTTGGRTGYHNNKDTINTTCNGSNCSNNSSQKSKCCCSNITMPWNSHSTGRTRLPVPTQGVQTKNRTSSPSSSSSSSSVSVQQQRLPNTISNSVSSFNLNRDTSPTSVCCYNTTNSNKNSFLNFNSAKQQQLREKENQEKLKKNINNSYSKNNNNNNRKIFRSESFNNKSKDEQLIHFKNEQIVCEKLVDSPIQAKKSNLSPASGIYSKSNVLLTDATVRNNNSNKIKSVAVSPQKSQKSCCPMLSYTNNNNQNDDHKKLTDIKNKFINLDSNRLLLNKNDSDVSHTTNDPHNRHYTNDEYLFSCDYFPPNGCNNKKHTNNNNNDSNLNKNQLITTTDNNLNLLNCFHGIGGGGGSTNRTQQQQPKSCQNQSTPKSSDTHKTISRASRENSTSSTSLNDVFQEELYNLNLSLTENLENINKSKKDADPNYHKRSLPTLNKTESDNRLANLRKYSEDLISLKAHQRYNASCDRSSPCSPTSPSTVVIRKLTPKLPKKSLNFHDIHGKLSNLEPNSKAESDKYNFGVVIKKTLSITPSPEEGDEYKFPTNNYYNNNKRPNNKNNHHHLNQDTDEIIINNKQHKHFKINDSDNSVDGVGGKEHHQHHQYLAEENSFKLLSSFDEENKYNFQDEDFSYIDSGDLSSTSDDVTTIGKCQTKFNSTQPFEFDSCGSLENSEIIFEKNLQKIIRANEEKENLQCKSASSENVLLCENFDANRKKFELLSDIETDCNQSFPPHQHRKSFSSPSNKHKYEKIHLDGVDSAKYSNKFYKLSPDNSTSGLNCFGSRAVPASVVPAVYTRLSPEKTIIMEKRRNTLDRLQRLGFGRRLNSNNENKNDKSNTKTERLKELTELLKGTSRGPQTSPCTNTSVTNDPIPAPPPLPPPPPIPPPRRPRKQSSLDRSIDLSSSSSSNSELKTDDTVEPLPLPQPMNKPSHLPEPKSTTKSKLQKLLRPNVSASNLDSYEKNSSATSKNQQQPYDPSKSISLGDDDLFTTTLSRPESRAIVGSYTQKTIPFRSASFSQVDYSSGKYIRSALGALKNSLMKHKNSNSVVENTNCTLPRKKEEGSKEIRRAYSEEPKYLLKSELSINLQDYSTESLLEDPHYPEEEEPVKRNSDIDTIEEEPSTESADGCDRIQDRLVQASEMVLESLAEEEFSIHPNTPTKDTVELQKATTCLIPVPVYESAVPEWNAPNREQMWINATEDEPTHIVSEEQKKCENVVQSNTLVVEENQDVENTSEDDNRGVLSPQSSDDLSNDTSEMVEQQAEIVDLENMVLEKIVIIESDESKPKEELSTQIIEVTPDSLEPAPVLEIAENSLEQENNARSNVISIVCSESDLMPSDASSVEMLSSRPESSETQLSDASRLNEFVEVRKRHSNNDNYLISTERYSPGGSPLTTPTSPNDEKRRIDKSRRRKGIYIQWPAIDKNNEGSDSNENSTPEDVRPVWQCEKMITSDVIEKESDLDLSYTDLSTLKARPARKSVDEPNLSLICKTSNNERYSDCRQSLEPTTPDSDPNKLSWPKGNPRRQSLTYQSSDEKDEPNITVPSPTTVRPFKNLFLRSDSISDNESERGSSRDRASASPAPQGTDCDLRRYSKRPLRGPYGQMLEAEMKKPTSKVQYDELLSELSRNDSVHMLSASSRSRNNSSQSFDDSNSQPTNTKTNNKTRKSNANLPVPMHTRTASSPSQLLLVTNQDLPSITHSHKRFPSSVDQRSLEFDKNVKNDITKKLSLDSNFEKSPKRTTSDTSDKHSKRSSSGASDKKRSLDEIRLSTRTTTPSERSFVLNTPETPKTALSATPELLAELLKGSSEKLVNEQLQVSQSNISLSSSQALPTAVLKCLDTRTHVVVELFNTEQSYVESLQTVVLKYLNPLKTPENAGIVDSQIVDEIFFMVPAILNIHERFLDELRRRLDSWDPLQKVGDAFFEVFSKPTILETYTAFVNNWNKAKDAIRLTKTTRPAFARFLETMAREHKGKLSLDNLLIKPVQKFPNYELIFSRLIKHTDVDHPDQKPLQDALKLVHDILLHLNCKEKEALANGQREATLRELEGVIEGISDLVATDRIFILFDLVSMPSGQATRKERGFFLFNDLLVITSIKRRSGTIRKPNATCPGSVACTLDTNKYKFLTKLSLDELEIVKSKDENLRKIMKEIEQLNEDCNKLQQISDMSTNLRCPHQLLEDAIRELQRENQRQLNERQSNDTQLSLLELTLNSSNGIQNMSVVFSKPDKRTQWEESFNEAKQKLATSLERHPVPEFMVSVPIRKTRAGLQFTCAAPTLGIQRDVWVCNSDGYVGQVCVLSLQPEPTVTSCNGVCNARILCVSSVPANIESSPTSNNSNSNVSISIEDTTRLSRNSISNSSTHSSQSQLDNNNINNKKTNNDCSKSSTTDINNKATVIRLDSGSSSEESETESQPEQRAPSPAVSTAAVATTITPSHKQQDSNTDDAEHQQSTMWLGTEDGCIHVYNCTDNIRIKKNKIKIQHISAVYSILYLDNRVFASLANGDLCIYSRDHNGWNTTSPLSLTIGTVTSPVTKLLNVYGKIWCAIQGIIKVLNTQTLSIENQLQISTESKPITNMTVLNNFVWISVQNSANVKCFHSNSYELVFEVNLAPSVNKMLSNCDDIIRQHKAACLRVTSLLACKDLIWVGTSAGVLLTISGQNVYKTGSAPQVTGIPHGHTGHVRFLTFVETDTFDKSDKKFPANRNSSTHLKSKSETANILVISGGDGYEDFRGIGNTPVGEIAGREDSTNHLLLWQV